MACQFDENCKSAEPPWPTPEQRLFSLLWRNLGKPSVARTSSGRTHRPSCTPTGLQPHSATTACRRDSRSCKETGAHHGGHVLCVHARSDMVSRRVEREELVCRVGCEQGKPGPSGFQTDDEPSPFDIPIGQPFENVVFPIHTRAGILPPLCEQVKKLISNAIT